MKDIDKLGVVVKKLEYLKKQNSSDENVGRTISELEKAVDKVRQKTLDDESETDKKD